MLFAKNKPTKTVPFEGGKVELQFLSKGVKDEIQSRLAALASSLSGIDQATLEKVQKGELDSIPESMVSLIRSIKAIEYYKLAHAIKSWSEDAEITEENVKELDEDIFNELVKTVNEMNELTPEERKN